MRALEASYEQQLSDARAKVAHAEAWARSAVSGFVAADADVARRGDYAASSVARASAAAEAATQRQHLWQYEAAQMREALAAAQQAAGESEARCVAREAEIRELRAALDEARGRVTSAHSAAICDQGRAAGLQVALDQSQDELSATRTSLEQVSAECTRAQEEATRLRAHARQLAQGDGARPRAGGAPQPSPMGSAAEWAALREERDSLVKLFIELRKVSEMGKEGAKSVRVGGGFERLPEYLARFTGVLPPELRLRVRLAAPPLLAHVATRRLAEHASWLSTQAGPRPRSALARVPCRARGALRPLSRACRPRALARQQRGPSAHVSPCPSAPRAPVRGGGSLPGSTVPR